MKLSKKKTVAVILLGLLVSTAYVWWLLSGSRKHVRVADDIQLSSSSAYKTKNKTEVIGHDIKSVEGADDIQLSSFSAYKTKNKTEVIRYDMKSVEGHSSGPGVLAQVPKPYNLLLVMVLSSYGNEKRRDAIRQSWRNSYVEKGKQFPVRFVVGTLLLNSSATEQLVTENKKHNDLLLFHDLLDVYRNLTRKVLQMFIWVDHHMNYSYLLKIDDDTFARLDSIESELRERKSTKALYWGYFIGDHEPTSEGKWEEHNWFLSEKYLPYALGGGYVLSADLVRRIVVNSDALSLYISEDVSVGTWTSAFDIERKHDARFQTEWQRAQAEAKDHNCDNRCLVVNELSVEKILEKHRNMASIGVLCKREKVREAPHRCYRWNVPPSHCCSWEPCV